MAVPLLVAGADVLAGGQWLADALGGLLVGLIVGLAATGVRLRRRRALPGRWLAGVVAAALAMATSLAAVELLPEERARVQAQAEPVTLPVAEWLRLGPAHDLARDLRRLGDGQRLVDLHWVAERERLAGRLAQQGWKEPARGLRGALRWLQPEPDRVRMAPLPRLQRGRLPAQVWVRSYGEQRRLVLRLWPASVQLEAVEATLWLGSLEVERIRAGWPLARVQARPVHEGELAWLLRQLVASTELWVRKPAQPDRVLPARIVREPP